MQVFKPVKKLFESVQFPKRNSVSVDAASVGSGVASEHDFVAFDGAPVARAEPLEPLLPPSAPAAAAPVTSAAVGEDQEGQITSRLVESAGGVGVLPESQDASETQDALGMTDVSKSVDTQTASLSSGVRYVVQLREPVRRNIEDMHGNTVWTWLDFSDEPGTAWWDYKPGVIAAQSVNAGRFEGNKQIGRTVNLDTLRELPLGHVLFIKKPQDHQNNFIVYASPPRIHPYDLSGTEQEVLKKRGIFEEMTWYSDFWASKPFQYVLRVEHWILLVMQYIDNILVTMAAHRKFNFFDEGRHHKLHLIISDYSEFVLQDWKNLDGKKLFLRTLAFCLNKQEAFEQSGIAVRLGCAEDQDLLQEYIADREDMDAILQLFGHARVPVPKPGIAKRLEQFARRHAPSEPKTTAEPETYYSM